MALLKKCISGLCILFCVSLNAQLDNNIFKSEPDTKPVPAIKSRKWLGELGMLNYLRNEEYFNPMNPGETLLGAQFKGLIHYHPLSNMRISGGLMYQKDFGDPKFTSRLFPLIQLRYTPANWTLNFGNLDAHVRHNMLEPMISYKDAITRPVEYGIQGVYRGRNFFYDGWLNWMTQVEKASGQQEEISFGQSMEINLLRDSFISISMPLQGLAYHKGGQEVNTSRPLITRFNTAAGLKVTLDSVIILESYLLNSLDNSIQLSQPYKYGWANLSSLKFLIRKYNELVFSWWYSQEFQTTMGNRMFSDVNLSYPYANTHSRSLIMLRWNYARPVYGNKIWIDTRVEPFYDLQYKKMEYMFGVFLKYQELF